MSHDNFFMQRCLDLAIKGIGKTYPNPLVGCVIVLNNKIISEGWHKSYGGIHAEADAINKVKDKSILKNCSLYVNLEPCNHHGKTPPCSDLILKYGIPKVIIGIKDPNKNVTGNGIEYLKRNGCNVKVNILKDECNFINRRFITFCKYKRPYITLKWAESNDGFIGPVKNKLNSGKDYSNNDTNYKPKFKIGSTLNIDLPRKKIERTIALRSLNGSNFFITQPLYSEEDFINLCKLSNKNSYKVLAGIFPIKNAKTFKNLNHKIDGINRNNTLFKKLKISSEEDFLKISSEHLINLLIKYKKDLDGVHIMTAGDLKLASKISEKI